MANCSRTEVFLSEWCRMCNTHAIPGHGILRACEQCDAYKAAKKTGSEHCQVFLQNSVQEAIGIIKKWSDKHPVEPDEPTYPICDDIDPDPKKTVKPVHNCRLCEIVNEEYGFMFKGVFHGFYVLSEIVPPSPLQEGHSGGVVADVVALVEVQDGQCKLVHPNRVRFIDGLAKKMIEKQEEKA